MIDLTPGELATVRAILGRHAAGWEVRAFGSRVRGPAKPYSDLDLAVYSPAPLTPGALFRVDIVDAGTVSPTFGAILAAGSEPIPF